jgi:hypothetical protein
MGRQIQLSMLPADRNALLREVCSQAPVEVVMRDGDSAHVQPLKSISDNLNGNFILWNKLLIPAFQRTLVDPANVPYYRVDEFALPVLEMSDSVLTEWLGKPALTQGRIYGVFDGKQPEFQKWYERITRYIRKRWRKNPVSLLGGYVGPAASEWFDGRGVLLPTFVPPSTDTWLRAISQQGSARGGKASNY